MLERGEDITTELLLGLLANNEVLEPDKKFVVLEVAPKRFLVEGTLEPKVNATPVVVSVACFKRGFPVTIPGAGLENKLSLLLKPLTCPLVVVVPNEAELNIVVKLDFT